MRAQAEEVRLRQRARYRATAAFQLESAEQTPQTKTKENMRRSWGLERNRQKTLFVEALWPCAWRCGWAPKARK